jgi:signal peptidase II
MLKMFSEFNTPLQPHSLREQRVFLLSSLLTLLVVIADQLSKAIIEAYFEVHETLPVIDGFFSITSVRNYGAAWSILSGYGWLLLIIAAILVAAGIKFFRTLTDGWIERYFAIFTVLGGVIGNSIDRIWRGAVVDFIDFHYYNKWSYPVFNIADIAICVGIGIYIISDIIRPDKKNSQNSAGNEDNICQ